MHVLAGHRDTRVVCTRRQKESCNFSEVQRSRGSVEGYPIPVPTCTCTCSPTIVLVCALLASLNIVPHINGTSSGGSSLVLSLSIVVAVLVLVNSESP